MAIGDVTKWFDPLAGEVEQYIDADDAKQAAIQTYADMAASDNTKADKTTVDAKNLSQDEAIVAVAATVPAAITNHKAEVDPHTSYVLPSHLVAGTGISLTKTGREVRINNLVIGAGGGSGGGPADQQNSKIANVLNYGAVGDSITDDTAAFQAAIDALSFWGGEVYVPSGIYRITGTINLRNGMTISGAGPYGTRLRKEGTGNLFQGTDLESTQIRDLGMEGVGTGSAIDLRLVNADSNNGVELRNLWIWNFAYGMYLDGIIVSAIDKAYIVECTNTGIYMTHSKGGGATSVALSNCYVVGTPTGYELDRGSYISFTSCAVDLFTTGYKVHYGHAISFLACGAEVGTTGYHFIESWGLSGNGMLFYNVTDAGVIVDRANITINGLYEMYDTVTAVNSVRTLGYGTALLSSPAITAPNSGDVAILSNTSGSPNALNDYVTVKALKTPNVSLGLYKSTATDRAQIEFGHGTTFEWAIADNTEGNLSVYNEQQQDSVIVLKPTEIDANYHKITHVSLPTNLGDAANKDYVDATIDAEISAAIIPLQDFVNLPAVNTNHASLNLSSKTGGFSSIDFTNNSVPRMAITLNSGVFGFYDHVLGYMVQQWGADGSVSFSDHPIKRVGAPVDYTDAANKDYVDAIKEAATSATSFTDFQARIAAL